MEKRGDEFNPVSMKSIIVLYSYHHHNTRKIANIFANVLNADIKTPQQVEPEKLQEYDMIGFGSGIYSAKHHPSILELVDKLPPVNSKKVFLFSTSGITGKSKSAKDHSILMEKLLSKGYTIVDEFQCKGFNTNSFLKLFGGMNKGRPNEKDLKNAEEFANKLKKSVRSN